MCRFLEESGYCRWLSRAVPGVVSRRVTSAEVLPRDRIEELTDSPNVATPAGRRDPALLLLAARTGLRPVDMLGLRLHDIDWVHGRITLSQHKTGTLLVLPLLADVGEAIADYLLDGRPAGAADQLVFLRTQAPFTALRPSSSLYHVASHAFARTQTDSRQGTGHGSACCGPRSRPECSKAARRCR